MINLTDDSIAPGIVTKERGRMDIVNGLVMKFDKSIKLTRYHSTCSEDCCRSFEDMMAKGHMKECCRCTCSAHTACIVAGAMKNGIFGAMEMLVSKHQWGVARVDYCCEQSYHMGHLDCSASSAFAIDMLNHGLFNGPTGTNPRMPSGPGLSRGWMATSDGGHQKWRNEAVYVQLVVRSNSGNGQRWRRLIDKVYSGEDQKGVRELSAWVGEGFIYHVCTGIVCHSTAGTSTSVPDAPSRLHVWDFSEFKLPPQSTEMEESVQAICVTPVPGANNPGGACSLFDWEGVELIPGQWRVFEQGVNEKQYDQVHQCPDQSGAVIFPGTNVADAGAFTVYISGCHMSGNPCPGAGIARSIRSLCATSGSHLQPVIVAVDCSESAMGGMADECFDYAESLDAMDFDMDSHMGLRWDSLRELLQKRPGQQFVLPGRDQDVECIAQGIRGTHEPGMEAIFLSPSLDAFKQTLKPGIPAAVAMGDCFSIPAYHHVAGGPERNHATTLSLKNFCMQHGFPVLCKGVRSGAKFCFNWEEVMEEAEAEEAEDTDGASAECAQAHFVQQFITGLEVTFAFSAFRGELLGCVRMTKNQHTKEGKVWGGSLDPVPADVYTGIATFVRGCCYTGGGEVECVHEVLSSRLFLIDFNPRFPSWIHASCITGVNLVGLLVERAAKAATASAGGDTTMPHGTQAVDGPHCASNGVKYSVADGENTSDKLIEGAHMVTPLCSAAFRRTVCEVAVTNCDIPRALVLPHCEHFDKNAVSSSVVPKPTKQAARPAATVPLKETPAAAVADYDRLCSDIIRYIRRRAVMGLFDESADSDTDTPEFVISECALSHNFETVTGVLNRAVADANAAVSGGSLELKNTFCLSVKTNPHPHLLRKALREGFVAECISLCEVQAALDAGFSPNRILLTGGGKFYNSGKCKLRLPPTGSGEHVRLHAVFADSLVDLKRIVGYINDPNHWLKCDVLGCRFSPAWIATSRFGLNVTDPCVMRAAAEEMRRCPPDVLLGAHFHFGSSFVGVDHWLGMAAGFLHLAREFSIQCNRPLSVLDVGGGWAPGVLNHTQPRGGPSTEQKLNALLFTTTLEIFDNTYFARFPEVTASRQMRLCYELGKCLSEDAGAVLSRVLEVREYKRPECTKSCRAVVMDSCIGELQCATEHLRAAVWLQPNTSATGVVGYVDGSSELNSAMGAQTPTQGNAYVPVCLPSGGTDMIWGRTCMEFDILKHNTMIPQGLQPGDYIVFTNAGAYDVSMNYSFGDGNSRPIEFL